MRPCCELVGLNGEFRRRCPNMKIVFPNSGALFGPLLGSKMALSQLASIFLSPRLSHVTSFGGRSLCLFSYLNNLNKKFCVYFLILINQMATARVERLDLLFMGLKGAPSNLGFHDSMVIVFVLHACRHPCRKAGSFWATSGSGIFPCCSAHFILHHSAMMRFVQ